MRHGFVSQRGTNKQTKENNERETHKSNVPEITHRDDTMLPIFGPCQSRNAPVTRPDIADKITPTVKIDASLSVWAVQVMTSTSDVLLVDTDVFNCANGDEGGMYVGDSVDGAAVVDKDDEVSHAELANTAVAFVQESAYTLVSRSMMTNEGQPKITPVMINDCEQAITTSTTL